MSFIKPRIFKHLVPAPLRRGARDLSKRWKFKRAVKRIAELSEGAVPTTEMLTDLQIGWGNEGYAARTDFLQEVANKALTTAGPILECGSGLTTILLGLLAGRRGVRTYSLEHISAWRQRVSESLEQFQIPCAQILHAPLRDFESFTWYDPPLSELPAEFGLVICDGPPGDTNGGRYGLFSVLGDRLPSGSVILLDDAWRAGEAAVLRRWATETKISVSTREAASGSFAVITREESSPLKRDTPAQSDLQHSDGSPSPLISVIIPAYNVAPYIGETLQSVFAQTCTDFEVIVVNDGSPDTAELEHILERYTERIRYLKQANRGASVARNAGLRAARGEFIAFLDADDLWLPNYLDEQLKFIQTQGCDVACADALIFGDTPDAGQTYMETVMETAPPMAEVTFLELVGAERSFITSGVVARREHILAVGLFDERLRNAQDFDLWLRLARHGARLAYQRLVLLRYRCHAGSLSGDAFNFHHRELRIFEKIEKSYPLTPAERLEVSAVIRKRRALLEYELGKLYLLEGDFEQARDSFARSNSSRRSWKSGIALWFTRAAPGILQALYLRRTQNANAK